MVSRRIQRVWDYIQIHYDADNQFTDIFINDEKAGLDIDRGRRNIISVGITRDYLIIAESNEYFNIWKRGDIEPTYIRHEFDMIFLNSDMCYFSVEENARYLLRAISTKSLLRWMTEPGFEQDDLVELDVIESRTQVLGLINDNDKIVGIDNVGHVLINDNGGNFRLYDYTIHPCTEIKLESETSPVLNPDGNYIVATNNNSNGMTYVLLVERYTTTRSEISNSFIHQSKTDSSVEEINKTDLEIEDDVILVWIDSETLLVYNTKAILLNVVTTESIDITNQVGNTDESKEIFILADGTMLGIEKVEEISRWLKWNTVKIPSHIPESVIDHVYRYVK
jgi:hypothetical protein